MVAAPGDAEVHKAGGNKRLGSQGAYSAAARLLPRRTMGKLAILFLAVLSVIFNPSQILHASCVDEDDRPGGDCTTSSCAVSCSGSGGGGSLGIPICRFPKHPLRESISTQKAPAHTKSALSAITFSVMCALVVGLIVPAGRRRNVLTSRVPGGR